MAERKPQATRDPNARNRARSAFWLMVILVALFGMGMLFLWEADTLVVTGIAYGWTFLYNGVVSFNADWAATTVEVVSAYIGASVWFIYSGLFVIGLVLNQQNR